MILLTVLKMLAPVGGACVGYLARQAEVNRLKQQICELQERLEKLMQQMEAYQSSVDDLILKYKKTLILRFKKRAACRGEIRATLLWQYALRDYAELLLKQTKQHQPLSDEETPFFVAMDEILEYGNENEEHVRAVAAHVEARYMKELKAMTPCEYTEIFQGLSAEAESRLKA